VVGNPFLNPSLSPAVPFQNPSLSPAMSFQNPSVTPAMPYQPNVNPIPQTPLTLVNPFLTGAQLNPVNPLKNPFL